MKHLAARGIQGSIGIALTAATLLAGIALAVVTLLATVSFAVAQTPENETPPPAAPDTTQSGTVAPNTTPSGAIAPPDTTQAPPARNVRDPRRALGLGNDRFEIGAAIADGPFDVLGTFAYHRFLRQGGPFENWVHVEVSGAATTYLNEGAVSGAFLLRPLLFIRRDGRLQPIVEVGPAGHIVVQVAEVQGFDETAFHTHFYLKTHAYAGFDLGLSRRWGLVARGRFTVPAHKPLDYAQIALFFR